MSYDLLRVLNILSLAFNLDYSATKSWLYIGNMSSPAVISRILLNLRGVYLAEPASLYSYELTSMTFASSPILDNVSADPSVAHT